ncbi:putative membrane protein YgcG [Catenulispora sp. GP43]|uniref:hypothetical protein n=1 Tax=Catenulispora sp. GP43 TaxID=3156263 RepID=UPI00351958EB
MGGLNRMENHQAAMERAQERHRRALVNRRRDQQDDDQPKLSVAERRTWFAIGGALAAMTAVVGLSSWLVLGTRWLGLALGVCVAAVALAAWYTVSGRTLGMDSDVRERVLERHYIGVAWYASMLRNTRERGGYERGLRRELTRLAAARLAERHGVNLYRDPQAAARVIGADLWPLVDPSTVRTAGTGGDARAGSGTGTSSGNGTSSGSGTSSGRGTGTDRPGARPPEVPIRAVAELIERLERM